MTHTPHTQPDTQADTRTHTTDASGTSLTEAVDVLRKISEKFPSSLQRLDEAVSRRRDVVSGVESLGVRRPAGSSKKEGHVPVNHARNIC